METFTYYPGCTLRTKAKDLDTYARISAEALGIVLAVGSGVAYAFYIALFGHSPVKDTPPLVLSFWISVFAAAELAVFVTVTGNWQLPSDAMGWGMTGE